MAAFKTLCSVVALLAIVKATRAGYTYDKCYSTGERCAGAPGKPYVKYLPCCKSGEMCGTMPSATAAQWGRFCMPPPKKSYSSSPKCYKTGERCKGAPGKPYVPYHPCCTSGESCMSKAGDWGGFCTPRSPKHIPYPSLPTAKPTSEPVSPPPGHEAKCYKYGERCMGAPGKPYIHWQPCCTYGETCMPKSGDWGGFCLSKHDKHKATIAPPMVEPTAAPKHKPYYKPYYNYYPQATEAPAVVTKAPVVTPASPKCYKTGERCGGSYGYSYITPYACCSEYDTCESKSGHWGSFCVAKKYGYGYGYPKKEHPKATLAPVTTKPKKPMSTKAAPTTTTTAATTSTAARSGIFSQFPGLPASFGCDTGAPPLAVNLDDDFIDVTGRSTLSFELPITVCDATAASFSRADAVALCQAIVRRFTPIDATLQCRVIGVSSASGRQVIPDALGLRNAERQIAPGVLLTFVIQFTTSLLDLILALLSLILAILFGSILPTVTADA